MRTARAPMWFCAATSATWRIREPWVKRRPATWRKRMGMCVCLYPPAQEPLPGVFVKKAVAALFAKVCAGKCHAKSVLLEKQIFVNICKISCWTHLCLQHKRYVGDKFCQCFWSVRTDAHWEPRLWIFLWLQNPILWDECCKRAERQPGGGRPTGSDHEEDGTMRWQVVDPGWDCAHQWSCQLRHDRRTREEQMCLLKRWGAALGFFFSAGMKSHFGEPQCTTVSQTGSHTVIAGQRRWKMHRDSLRVGHTLVCVLVSSIHVCLRVQFATWAYFSLTFYICLSKVVFSFECVHNAFQFIHDVFYKLLRHRSVEVIVCHDAHFRGPISEIRRCWRKSGLNFVLHSLAAWVAWAEVQ